MPSIITQLILNGIIAGAIYALVASGFSLTYRVTKFMHFAHGSVIALAAYLFFLFVQVLEFPFIAAFAITMILTAVIGAVIDWIVYKPLRKRNASSAVLLIASIALLILINSLILMLFGADVKSIPIYNPVITLLDARITLLQIIIILTSVVLFIVLWFLMKKTKIGMAMRAVADNQEVAETVGVNPQTIYTHTFLIGSLFGGIAGMLVGMEQNLYPEMGTSIVIKGFTGAVIGGLTSVPGAVVGSFFLGIVENLGIWWLPSGYKDAIAFGLLFIFLLVKPSGIFGGPLKQ